MGRLPGPAARSPQITVEDDGRGTGHGPEPTPTASRSCGSAPSASAPTLQISQRTAGNAGIGTTVAVTLGDSDRVSREEAT